MRGLALCALFISLPLFAAPAFGQLSLTRSVIDSNGMPIAYPQYTPTGPVTDGHLTQVCQDNPSANRVMISARCSLTSQRARKSASVCTRPCNAATV